MPTFTRLGAFNQEKILRAFSVIVITDGSFADLNKMFRFLKCAELCAAAGWRERREVWEMGGMPAKCEAGYLGRGHGG